MKRIVFITGASSGIGMACAKTFAANGDHLILNARRGEKLEALKNELTEKFETEILLCPFDVRDRKAVFSVIDQIPEPWKNIDILINNAGLASGLDSFQNASLDDWETMIDTNVKGLLYVSKAIIPLMKTDSNGHIFNIGSIAGREVYANGNVYCSTKFAVDALSKAMRIDLLPLGIKVTQIAPGAVETEFSIVRFHGDKERADKVYQGFSPLTGMDVAETILYAANLPAHVNLNDVLIMPSAQAAAGIIRKEQ